MNLSSLRFFLGLSAASLSIGLLASVLARFLMLRLSAIRMAPPEMPQRMAIPPLNRAQLLLAAGLLLSLFITAFGDFSYGLLTAVFVVGGWYGFQKGPVLKKKYDSKKRLEKLRE